MEWVMKIIRLWQDVSKVANHACFQFEKSQNKLDLMQSFLLRRFTKLIKIKFKTEQNKMSHLINFPFSFCLNLYKTNILHLAKTFRIKTF